MNKFISIVSLLMVGVLSVSAGKVSYTPDNITIFKNPERGYTEELSARVTASPQMMQKARQMYPCRLKGISL